MNTKSKFVRFALAATFSSLLWAGCASDRTYYGDASTKMQPLDLTKQRANTHPESKNGLNHYARWDRTVDATAPTVGIEEAAGAQRRYK